MSGKKVEVRAVRRWRCCPEKSDNAVTMSINEWAAEAYPTVQAHLEAAKTLDSAAEETHDELTDRE